MKIYQFHAILETSMPRKKNESLKTLQKIEISVTEILIAENDALKPYIQTFHYEPENIALQALGSVFGIFEIDDQSEDSAYIVNFLTSIVKKEYYTHPKRSSIESLEATLHKINMALSKLIKQDNTAWLGKLNASLCVFDKNQIHFSVSGKAKTLLIRDNMLTDISDGLSEESELHPLKTFTEVSSGRLKENDKIILTTPGLFEVITPQDLQKNADRFTNEQFSQYIKTALVNQLLFGGTIIVNVQTKTIKTPALAKQKAPKVVDTEIPNAFSQIAFSKKQEVDAFIETPAEEIIEQDSEYTDSKTGHIYIQGDIPEVKSNEKWLHFVWQCEDISRNFFAGFKKYSSRFFRQLQQFAKTQTENIFDIYHTAQEKRKLKEKPIHVEVHADTTRESLLENDANDFNQYEESTEDTYQGHEHNRVIEESEKISTPFIHKVTPFFTRLLPQFTKLHVLYRKLTNKQKLMVLGALFAIFIIPYLIISAQGKGKVADTKTPESQPMVQKNPLEQDRKMHSISNTQTIFSNNSILKIVLLKNVPFAITKTAVVSLEDPAKSAQFTLPQEYGNTIIHATNMNDLSTIFLLTDTGKMISFSPLNKRFTENAISLPDVTHIADISAYLTYVYVLDSKSNAILRYPRATGGFAESTQWLKESLEIQDNDTMTVDEDVYIAKNNQLVAYNRGKRDSITFETSETPIVFSRVFSVNESQNIYTVDAVNGRVIKFDKNGGILGQFSHENIKNAQSIAIDEQNQIAYITTDTQTLTLKLN